MGAQRRINRIFNGRTIACFIAAIIVACVFLTLGDTDDSPGLGGMGLVMAFALIMRGIHHAHVMPKGYILPILTAVPAVLAVVFPIVLALDGEVDILSPVTLVCGVMGAIFAVATVMLIRRAKR